MKLTYKDTVIEVDYEGSEEEPGVGWAGAFELVSVKIDNLYDIDANGQRCNYVDIVDILSDRQRDEISDLVFDVIEDRRTEMLIESGDCLIGGMDKRK